MTINHEFTTFESVQKRNEYQRRPDECVINNMQITSFEGDS